MEKWYLVQDRKTGSVVACKEAYAKELQREGEKKIVAEKGDSNWEKLSKLKSDGKI